MHVCVRACVYACVRTRVCVCQYTHEHTYIELARTIYIRCIYGISCRDFIRHTVLYGVYIQFWPTLYIHMNNVSKPSCMCECCTTCDSSCELFTTCDSSCECCTTCDSSCELYTTCDSSCEFYTTCDSSCECYTTCDSLCEFYTTCDSSCDNNNSPPVA